MYLIRTDDPNALCKLAESLDAIDDFAHWDLGALTTLALIELCDAASGWITGQPVVYDESNGLAIFAFAPDGVAWLAQNTDALTEFDADLDSLGAFVRAPGAVYALDTF